MGRLAVAGGLLFATCGANAAVMTVTGSDSGESIGDDIGGVFSGGDFYTVPAFDPALGTLQSVGISFVITDNITGIATVPPPPVSDQAGLQGPDGTQIASAFQTIDSLGSYIFTGSGTALNVADYILGSPGAFGSSLHFIDGNTLNESDNWTGDQYTTVILTYNYLPVPEPTSAFAGGFALVLALGMLIHRKTAVC